MFTRICCLSILLLCSGCFTSSEQKTAEGVAQKQDAEIHFRKFDGKYEMYAELNSKERRWVESNMRQTNTVSSDKKNEAYVLLTEKMSQGSWVWKKEEENEESSTQ